jgi:hypothetical protein
MAPRNEVIELAPGLGKMKVTVQIHLTSRLTALRGLIEQINASGAFLS